MADVETKEIKESSPEKVKASPEKKVLEKNVKAEKNGNGETEANGKLDDDSTKSNEEDSKNNENESDDSNGVNDESEEEPVVATKRKSEVSDSTDGKEVTPEKKQKVDHKENGNTEEAEKA